MAFRNRSAAKAAPAKPAPKPNAKPAPRPAARPAPAPAKAPARRPAPPAPPVEEQEEDFFPDESNDVDGQEYVEESDGQEGHDDTTYEEEQEPAPAPRRAAPSRPAAPAARAPQRSSFSGSRQSGAGAPAADKIRLTGIWESKGSRDILRGGIQDNQALIDWLSERVNQKVQVLVYRNNVNKQGDPPFTVYIQEDNYVPGQGGGNRGGYSRGGYGRGNYNRGGGDSRDRF